MKIPQSASCQKNKCHQTLTKYCRCLWMLVLAGFLAASITGLKAQSSHGSYDQQFVAIQPQALSQELLKADRDPIKLYSLVRQADTQKQIKIAYDTLNRMRHTEPNNATVLAAYCFAFQVGAGDYASPGEKHLSFTPEDFNDYTTTLLKAKSLDPKLWLPYAVQGHNFMLDPEFDRKALSLLQKAVALAPNISYTHILLAEAYGVYGTPYHSFQAAARECDVARHLKPVSAKNADILFDIYDIRMPNREKATDAKRYLLSSLPPDYKFSPDFRDRLAKY